MDLPFTPISHLHLFLSFPFFQNALNMLHSSESVFKSWHMLSCGFMPWMMTASLPTSPTDRRFGIPGCSCMGCPRGTGRLREENPPWGAAPQGPWCFLSHHQPAADVLGFSRTYFRSSAGQTCHPHGPAVTHCFEGHEGVRTAP